MPLWLTEWLAEALDLRPGMRVLDLGCGRAMSSVFLRREFGVQVWATDLWFSASENLQRIRDAGVEDGVFPIHADARALPFAAEFFDADRVDRFLHLLRHGRHVPQLPRPVRQAGRPGWHRRGGADARDGRSDSRAPSGVVGRRTSRGACTRRPGGARHWGRTGILDIEVADTLADGWRFWLDWLRLIAPENATEIRALEADAGRHLGYVRVVGRRRADAPLTDPVVSVPTQYRNSRCSVARGRSDPRCGTFSLTWQGSHAAQHALERRGQFFIGGSPESLADPLGGQRSHYTKAEADRIVAGVLGR